MSNLRPAMLGLIVGMIALLLGARAAVSDDDSILINNDPSFQIIDGVTVPIIGVRPLTNIEPTAWNIKGDFSISDEAIIQSAWYATDIKEKLRINDISSINIEDVIRFLRDDYPIDNINSSSAYDITGIYIQYPPDSFKNVFQETNGYINASAISRMVAAGAIDVTRPEKVSFGGKTVEYFNVNKDVSDDMKAIYTDIESKKMADFLTSGWESGGTVNTLSNNLVLASALAFSLGDITFGKPLVRSASEMGLVIPPSIEREFDIYWIDFAVTYRNLEISSLAEIGFNVDLPSGYFALELIPLRIGTDMNVDTKLKTPEIGVEVKGVKLSLGEFYSKRVEYSYARPTVTAFGLQESTFSWSLSEEAITSGAQRFSAIVGVPKGTDQLELKMSGKVRTKDTLWGSGTIAGTNPSNFSFVLN